MNGFDFEEDNSETDFTFIGTGSYWGLTGMVLAIILTGILIGALIYYTQFCFLGADDGVGNYGAHTRNSGHNQETRFVPAGNNNNNFSLNTGRDITVRSSRQRY